MCLICIDYQKGRMNLKEALQAAREMVVTVDVSDETGEHYKEVLNDLSTAFSDEQIQKWADDGGRNG